MLLRHQFIMNKAPNNSRIDWSLLLVINSNPSHCAPDHSAQSMFMAALIRDAGDGPWIHGGAPCYVHAVVHVHPWPSFHAGLGQGLATLSSDQGPAAWSVFLDWLGGGSSNAPRDAHLVENLCGVCLDRLQMNGNGMQPAMLYDRNRNRTRWSRGK
jgi:hypothetical protein